MKVGELDFVDALRMIEDREIFDLDRLKFEVTWAVEHGGWFKLTYQVVDGGSFKYEGPIHPNRVCEGKHLCLWCGAMIP